MCVAFPLCSSLTTTCVCPQVRKGLFKLATLILGASTIIQACIPTILARPDDTTADAVALKEALADTMAVVEVTIPLTPRLWCRASSHALTSFIRPMLGSVRRSCARSRVCALLCLVEHCTPWYNNHVRPLLLSVSHTHPLFRLALTLPASRTLPTTLTFARSC